MILRDHISIILTAAAVRRDQWKALVDNFGELQAVDAPNFDPGDVVDELWEVWGGMELDPEDTEAKDMSDALTEAIDAVQAAMKKGKFYE